MTYGERLKLAIDRRGDTLSRDISRKEIAAVAGCSVQNIGMILSGAKGPDQKLSTESHAKVAAFLKVNPNWLLDGTGNMDPASGVIAPSELTPSAIEIGVLFDMIPSSDKIRRARAFNNATDAIIAVLQSVDANAQASSNQKKPPV